MLVVHHLNNSRSQRILWLLEELGVPYEIKRYQRNPLTLLAPPELKKVHPLGKSPVVTDDGNVLAESGAIITYILNKYGNGRLRPPSGSAEGLKFDFFMHYAEGSVMPPLLLSLIFSKISQPPVPFIIRPIAKAIAGGVRAKFIGPQLKTHFDYLESELASRDWFAGPEFSAADIQMSFAIEAGAAREGFASRPRLQAWLERARSRPGYKKAIENGGEFSL